MHPGPRHRRLLTTRTPTIPRDGPSRLAEAHWLGCVYVITAVARGKAAVTNAFLLAGATEEGKYFEPLDITVI